MPAKILDGTKIANDIRLEVAAEVRTMTAAESAPAWQSSWSGTIRPRRFTFAAKLKPAMRLACSASNTLPLKPQPPATS